MAPQQRAALMSDQLYPSGSGSGIAIRLVP